MKLIVPRPSRPQAGFALVTVLLFLAVSLVLLGGSLAWTSHSRLTTQRNNQYNRTLAVAEAATEAVLARMLRDFQSQGVQSDLGVYCAITPAELLPGSWADHYDFSDGEGRDDRIRVVSAGPSVVTNLYTEFAGLYGLVDPYSILAVAQEKQTPFSLPAAVRQDFQLASIPVFQFAIFYGMDLEINPGPVMNVTGKVHGNSDLYVAPVSGLTFWDAVTAVRAIHHNRHPNDPTGGGKVLPVYKAKQAQGVSALTLPVGTSNSPEAVRQILEDPAPGESPQSLLGKQRYYNKADLLVEVTGTEVVVKTGLWQEFQPVAFDLPNAYSFLRTNLTFFDGRENKWTLGTELDVAALRQWLTGPGATLNGLATYRLGHSLNSILVIDRRAVSGKLTVVRVKNGQHLPPAGLTVATARPLYVWGHFNAPNTTPGFTNTSATLPASLVADAITVLSGNWLDGNSSKTLDKRLATHTTVNAAFLAGIVKTTVASGQKHYSGGVENFPRLLEDWSGKTLTYNGSMVVLFESQHGTGFWQQTGNYYNAPTRKWAFDLNFLDYRRLPPGTPQVQKLVRGQWETVAIGRSE